MILIDASVALKWFVIEKGSERATDLFGKNICAPSLILPEVANGLWKIWRRGTLTAAVVRDNIDTLRANFSELTSLEALASRAGEIALELDHPVYDCFYLADAEQRGLSLVTADERLLRKIADTGFAGLAVDLELQ